MGVIVNRDTIHTISDGCETSSAVGSCGGYFPHKYFGRLNSSQAEQHNELYKMKRHKHNDLHVCLDECKM